MPENDNKPVTPASAKKEVASLPGAALKTAMPGGFGGASSYVPTQAEVQEQKRIYEALEKERGGG